MKLKSILLPIIFALHLSFELVQSVSINETDQQAFLKLYQSLGGDNWLSKPPMPDPCNWFQDGKSVTCTDDGKIYEMLVSFLFLSFFLFFFFSFSFSFSFFFLFFFFFFLFFLFFFYFCYFNNLFIYLHN